MYSSIWFSHSPLFPFYFWDETQSIFTVYAPRIGSTPLSRPRTKSLLWSSNRCGICGDNYIMIILVIMYVSSASSVSAL